MNLAPDPREPFEWLISEATTDPVNRRFSSATGRRYLEGFLGVAWTAPTRPLPPGPWETALWNLQVNLDFVLWDRTIPLSIRLHAVDVLPAVLDIVGRAVPDSAALFMFWDGLIGGGQFAEAELRHAVVKALTRQFASSNAACREAAVRGITELRDPQLVGLIEDAAADPNISAEIRQLAADALKESTTWRR